MKKFKHRGRLKLTYDLVFLLGKKRIIIDNDFKKLLRNIFNKKYQDNKRYYLDEKL